MTTYSYSNTLGTGDRTATITVTRSGGSYSGPGTIQQIVDGVKTDAGWWLSGAATLTFDLGSAKIIKQARWYQSNSGTHGLFKWQGSNDNSSYTDIGGAFTQGGARNASNYTVHHTLIDNTTAYRYYRLTPTTGSYSGSPDMEEIEFYIEGSSNDEPDTSFLYNPGGNADTDAAGGQVASVNGNSVDRTAYLIQTSQFTTTDNIDPHNLIDGAVGNNGTDSISFSASGANFAFIWDFGGLGGKKWVVDAIQWVQSNSTSQGNWDFAGSDDNVTWTDIQTNFSLVNGSSNNTTSFTNTTAYRFYRLQQHSGGATSNSPWCQEIRFKCAPGQKSADDLSSYIVSYSNGGGSGDRTSGGNTVTVTTDATLASGTINNLVDGAKTTSTSDAIKFNTAQSGKYLKFDFGSGKKKIVNEIKITSDAATDQGKWQVSYSDDDSTYTNVSNANANWGGNTYNASVVTMGVPVVAGHRYWKITAAGSISGTPNIEEVEFALIDDPSGFTGTWGSTESADTFAGSGGILGGSWASTEAKDVFAGVGGILGGSWHSTEAKDLFSAAGYPQLTGTWGSIEGLDTFAAHDFPGGPWGSTEAKDTFAGAGGTLGGSWHSTELKDLFLAAGYPASVGTWGSTEAKDQFAGSAREDNIAVWGSVEGKDTFAATGFPAARPNLGIDGSAAGGGHDTTGAITSANVTLSTSHSDDIIVLYVTTGGFWSQGEISSITDTAGLTWTRRQKLETTRTGVGGAVNAFVMEVWYAHAPSPLVSDVITAHTATGTGYINMFALGVCGANTGIFFDEHSGLPASVDNHGSGNPSLTVSAINTEKVMLLGFYGSDDVQVTAAGGSLSTFLTSGSQTEHNGRTAYGAVGYAIKTGQQTNDTVSFTQVGGSSNDRFLMADFIPIEGYSGTLAVTEAKDTWTSHGSLIGGRWQSTEAKDQFAVTGYPQLTGTMNLLEGTDYLTLPPFGTWGSVETRDTFAGTGFPGKPLSIDAHAHASNHDTATATIGITTTTTNDIIVLQVFTGGFFSRGKVVSVSDTAGSFWRKRHTRAQLGVNPISEIWWAKKSAIGPTTITVNFDGQTGFIVLEALAIAGARADKPWDTHTGAGWYTDNFGSGNPQAKVFSNCSRGMILEFYNSNDVTTNGAVTSNGGTSGFTLFESNYNPAGETNGQSGRVSIAYKLFGNDHGDAGPHEGDITCFFGQNGGASNNRVIMQDIIVADNDPVTTNSTDDLIRWHFDGHGNQMILAMSGSSNSATKEFTTFESDTVAVVCVLTQASQGAKVDHVSDSGGHTGWTRRSIVTDGVSYTLETWWCQFADPFSGTVTVTLDSNVQPGDILGFIVNGINGPDVFQRGEIWDGDSSLPAHKFSDAVSYQSVGPFSTLNENVLEVVVAANASSEPTGFQQPGWIQFIGDFFGSVSGELVSHSPLFNIALQVKFSGPVVNNDSTALDVSPQPVSWFMLADAMPVGPTSPPQGTWASTDAKDHTSHTGDFTAIGIANGQGWVGFPPNSAAMAATDQKDRATNTGAFTAIWDINGWIGYVPAFCSWHSTEAKDVWAAHGWVLGPTTILARWESVEPKDSFGFASLFTWYTTPDSHGDRTSRITVTTNASLGGSSGVPETLVNGLRANNAASAIWVNISQPAAMWFQFDFGSPKVVNEALWFQNGPSAQPGLWKWQGSNDASTWTDLSATFVLNGGNSGSPVLGDFSSNQTPYRYYRILQTTNAGGNDTPWLWEVEFKVAGFSGTMGAAEAKDRMNYQVQLIPTATPIPARKRRLLIVT